MWSLWRLWGCCCPPCSGSAPFWLTIPLLAVIPVAVEYLQWRTATGAADVDDAILNFIGGVLGYVFVRTCQMIHAHWEKKRAQ